MSDQNDKQELKETVLVDKKPVSVEELKELTQKPDIRLHQESEGSFRTLHRMNG